jgi:LysM repeat protein
MQSLTMKTRLALLLPIPLLLAASGCVTIVDEAAMARQQSDMEILREDVQRLQEQLKRIDLEQQNLARDMETLRRSARTETGSGASRVDELERRLQALAAARDEDRKAIIDELSRKMATIVGGQSSPSPARSGAATETGYEHVVQQGETLSQIAKAYKVSASAIMKANNLKSSTIRVGQKLFIPQQ